MEPEELSCNRIIELSAPTTQPNHRMNATAFLSHWNWVFTAKVLLCALCLLAML